MSYATEPFPLTEIQVKAVYLFNFAKFVTWPDEIFANAEESFHICVLGDDPFGEKLDLAVKNEKVKKRPILLQRLHELSTNNTCHALFISRSEQLRLTTIFTYTQQRPILTVSDMEDFVLQGGMIQLYSRDNKVRFFIDPQTLREAKLVPSARLLQLANIISH